MKTRPKQTETHPKPLVTLNPPRGSSFRRCLAAPQHARRQELGTLAAATGSAKETCQMMNRWVKPNILTPQTWTTN